MSGVDSPAQRELDALQAEMRRCRRCIEAGFPVQGPAVFSGPAAAPILLIGQAPAQMDLNHGSRPWSGAGGKRLLGWLAEAGFEEPALRRTAYMAALTRCFPGKQANGRGDRAPTRAEQALCFPYLQRELELIVPKVIVLIGGLAIARFLGPAKLSDVIGRAYPCDAAVQRRLGVRLPAEPILIPLPHPSGASLWLNQPANQTLVGEALACLAALRPTLSI